MNMNLEILTLARGLSEHAAARQSVLAQNVANADTPGYAARDLRPFSEAYFDTPAPEMRATRAGHFTGNTATSRFGLEDVTTVGADSPNGNTVSLEDQMLRGAEVKASHELALGVYSKTMDIMRTALGRGR
ncbi:FlgB family protein [Oceanibium sediminis]|uniref:FlgB family protein n=1 Tax=Oceanibium sediminis TaxID=2026339 RepID=UPI000DD4A99A|nr:FlgB family protein [Oceanibium sediminis]